MNRATRPFVTALRRTVDRLARASRHDLVLAVIPAALLFGALAGTTSSVPTTAAVFAASVVGALAMLDALFLNPPRRPSAGSPRG